MSEFQLPTGVTAVSTPERGFQVDTMLGDGTVMAHGAHILDWSPRGHQPVLWTSELAVFEPGSAIRGGVPICFPWFGRGPAGDAAEQHGFARLQQWNLVDAAAEATGEARLVFELLGSSIPGQDALPADASARLTVAFGTNLTMSLTATAGEQGFTFEEALHTYYLVGDVRRIRLEGLDEAPYLDNLQGLAPFVQSGDVTFPDAVDRIYTSQATTRIVDDLLQRTITVEKANSASTVVWNPGPVDGPKLSNSPADDWSRFVCVETANVRENAITLAPGESHTMTVTVQVD